ncbi:restriction endonuclease subunit S [Alloalcanivorax xenomutans]|uniref:restriction endonuclease subunit S n=1 Tax=Alloalcanivorax xenomutans TaxID=1094342 RepID=UPI00292F4289|nr:restriction endonuclease subunit S [Alloalcanivorax xenomutans]WOA30138.1 restriction endonuclease subunit S [Alloalcanivorax xenomutans]
MSNLVSAKLKDLVDNFDNQRVPLSVKQRSTLEKKFRYYGAQGVIDYVDDYIFDGEYILVAEDGENLKSQRNNICNYVTGKFWVNNHAHIIRAKENNNTKYLYYALNLVNFRNYVTGSAQPKLTKDNLGEIVLHVHRCDEQQKIARVISTLDAKIELNNRINAELEAMAKTLYDYWFVQFDFPDANGKPYKTSGGKMVYNPTLKREIPEGWEATTVGKISKTELGGTPSTAVDEYWQNADIPWLSSAETASFPIITSEQKITPAGIDNSAATLLPKGTVVISIVRYIRPSILGIDAATNQSVVGIRECKRLKSSFIYPYFCSEVPRLMGLRTGAQQPHINKGVIEDSPIVIPCEKVLTAYYKAADPIFEKIMNLALQSHELMQLRDWLLPMLMNGQVTVR